MLWKARVNGSYIGMFGYRVGNAIYGNLYQASQKIYVKNNDDVEWIVTHVGAESSDSYSPDVTRNNVLVKGS